MCMEKTETTVTKIRVFMILHSALCSDKVALEFSKCKVIPTIN
jgi:hypothetical protein